MTAALLAIANVSKFLSSTWRRLVFPLSWFFLRLDLRWRHKFDIDLFSFEMKSLSMALTNSCSLLYSPAHARTHSSVLLG